MVSVPMEHGRQGLQLVSLAAGWATALALSSGFVQRALAASLRAPSLNAQWRKDPRLLQAAAVSAAALAARRATPRCHGRLQRRSCVREEEVDWGDLSAISSQAKPKIQQRSKVLVEGAGHDLCISRLANICQDVLSATLVCFNSRGCQKA